MAAHFTIHPKVKVISACSNANMITKEYYDFLVGEINRGTMVKAVCCVENTKYNYKSYHLLS